MDTAAFAAAWIADWNSHDLDRILAHYAEEVVFHSPKAKVITGDGVVRGIPALRAYWTKGLAARPNLKFELEETFVGHASLTLLYRGEDGRRAAETMLFDDAGRVVRSTACYR
jgi:ketosteroid isomerase-like protein